MSDDKGGDKVVSFGKPKLVGPGEIAPNIDLVEVIEALLARVKSGEVQAAAFVEIRNTGGVATHWMGSMRGWYHQLNSGAARLAARLSSEQDDYLEPQ